MQTSSPDTSPQTVLIVEDDADIARIAAAMLKKEGYAVYHSPDATGALAWLQSSTPDLILTDVMMPEIDGLQLVAALKADEATATIPVMVMSALTDDADAQRARDAGAEYYLKKPFERAQLVAAVKGVFAMSRARRKLDAS